jgi:hypothetical protein
LGTSSISQNRGYGRGKTNFFTEVKQVLYHKGLYFQRIFPSFPPTPKMGTGYVALGEDTVVIIYPLRACVGRGEERDRRKEEEKTNPARKKTKRLFWFETTWSDVKE